MFGHVTYYGHMFEDCSILKPGRVGLGYGR